MQYYILFSLTQDLTNPGPDMRIEMPKQKLVYPLREVCRMTGLPDRIIKRWEGVFPQIKPVRNRAANRNYLEKDIRLLFYLRELIYNQKLTEEEAREKISEYHPKQDEESKAYLKRLLGEIRMEVEEIRRLLEE